MINYFREKPYRIFYLIFFVLIYVSALLQAITPLGPLRIPAYIPEKVKIDLGKPTEELVEGYFGENFFYPRGRQEGWMRNHGLIVLNNISPTNLKVDLIFNVKSYRGRRYLRVSLSEQVIKRIRLDEDWQTVRLDELILKPGELFLYFYAPEGAQKAPELGSGKNEEVSMVFRNFKVKFWTDYTSKEKAEIIKQRIFNFINNINYVYTSVVAFIFLLIAFALHAYLALSSEERA